MPFDSRTCEDGLPYNDTLGRFDCRYWTIDYPLTAIATIVSEGTDKFNVYTRSRSNKDLIGVLWNTYDRYGHLSLNYQSDYDYTGTILAFQANFPMPWESTVTINVGGTPYVCRLFPYRQDGANLIPTMSISRGYNIPAGMPIYSYAAVAGGKPNIEGQFWYIIDFSWIRTGFEFTGDKVPTTGITDLFISITDPVVYGLGMDARVRDEGQAKSKGPKTVNLDYITIYCAPGTVISKGDIIQCGIRVPTMKVKSGGLFSKGKVKYNFSKLTTLTLQAQEFIMNGPSEPYGFKIKLANTVKNALWRGDKALAVSLRRDTPVGDRVIDVSFSNITVSGSRTVIAKRNYPNAAHEIGMTSGFDDTYNITPYRQVEQAYQLGYRGFWTSYMGMSHYFKAYGTTVNGAFKVELERNATEPLNHPTVRHLEDLFARMTAYGYKFVWSTAYEILNSVIPVDWKQLDADGDPALTGWSPPSSFIIPTKDECLDYLANVIKHGLSIMQGSGMSVLSFQIGEPWWWDGSYAARKPCIYDPYTRAMYTAETGQPVPTPWIRDFMEPVTDNQRPYLEWLGLKLGRSTNYIRDSVKAAYPAARSTLLFFTPQIMNPAAEMLTIINFPKSEWVYPNYDFMQIEDYDWLINGTMNLNPLTFEAAIDVLLYPAEVVQYFVGFVNTAAEKWVWPNMNIAIWNAQDRNIGQISVWAYPQVIRDSMIYVPGPRPVPPTYPALPRIHGQEGVEDPVKYPLILVNINDEMFLHSGVGERTIAGHTWDGVGFLGSIGKIEETLAGRSSGLEMKLTGIPHSLYSEVVKTRRNQKVTVYMTVNGKNVRVVNAGRVYEQAVEVNEGSLTVTYRLGNRLSLIRDSFGGTYTMHDQLAAHPGDTGLEFITAMRDLKLDWGPRT